MFSAALKIEGRQKVRCSIMGQNTETRVIPLTKDQFTRIVNDALIENGEQAKPADEISEGYDFYTRLWEEDGGRGDLEMAKHEGRMRLTFG